MGLIKSVFTVGMCRTGQECRYGRHCRQDLVILVESVSVGQSVGRKNGLDQKYLQVKAGLVQIISVGDTVGRY